MQTPDLLKLIIKTAEDFKAMDLKILDVSEVCSFADYFVIMSGNSTTQTQTIAEKLNLASKHADNPPISVEGLPSAEWCLLDFGDVIVHIFLPAKRDYYQLEELWKEGRDVPVESLTPGE